MSYVTGRPLSYEHFLNISQYLGFGSPYNAASRKRHFKPLVITVDALPNQQTVFSVSEKDPRRRLVVRERIFEYSFEYALTIEDPNPV